MVYQTNKAHKASDIFDDAIDFRRLLVTILEGRSIIATTIAAFIAVGVSYALLAPPVYRANSYILVEDNAQGVPGLDDTAEIITADTSVAQELYLIKSRTVLGAVVDELDLTTHASPIYMPLIGAALVGGHASAELADAPFGLGSYAWGGEKLHVSSLRLPTRHFGHSLELLALDDQQFALSYGGQELLTGTVGEVALSLDGEVAILIGTLVARPGTLFEVRKVGRFETILSLQDSLLVSERGRNTGVIEIALEGPNKDYILKVVGSVATHFYSQNVKRLATEAESSLNFLDKQIRGVKIDLAKSEETLNDFKSEHVSVNLPLEAGAALDSLVQIEADINAMSISEADISRRYTPQHPSYISFIRQQNNLQQQRGELRDKLALLPNTQKEIMRLTRHFEANQSIFISLDKRRQQLAMLKASRVGSVRLLDSAAVLPNRVSPNRKLIVMASFLLGSLFGLLVLVLRSLLKRGIIDPQAFTKIGLTVHATIPFSANEPSERPTNVPLVQIRAKEKKEKNFPKRLLAHDYPDDSSIEALRSFRTCLRFLMMNAKNNLVMISSGNPSVGKSFVAVNLAAVIAKSGQRVLIVDADMRKSYLHRTFHVNPERGLADVLAGTLRVSDAIKQTAEDNLHYLPRGKIPNNPSELLIGPMFKKLAENLSEAYDLVFFDTPPILAVTDASIIGPHCGTNMMVARFGTCTAGEIDAAHDRFRLNGVNIKGAIFNAVQKRAGGYYYGEPSFYGSSLGGYNKASSAAPAHSSNRPHILSSEVIDDLLRVE